MIHYIYLHFFSRPKRRNKTFPLSRAAAVPSATSRGRLASRSPLCSKWNVPRLLLLGNSYSCGRTQQQMAPFWFLGTSFSGNEDSISRLWDNIENPNQYSLCGLRRRRRRRSQQINLKALRRLIMSFPPNDFTSSPPPQAHVDSVDLTHFSLTSSGPNHRILTLNNIYNYI